MWAQEMIPTEISMARMAFSSSISKGISLLDLA
jgi:hypothetical protein